MISLLNKLGGRKNALTLICLIAAVAIDLTTERGLSSNLLTLMLGISGLYNISNVFNKKVTSHDEVEAPVAPAINESVFEEIAALKQNQQMLEQYAAGLLSTVEGIQSQVEASNKRVAALLSLNNKS